MRTKVYFWGLVVLLMVFLNGCVNYSESTVLNKDFSGKAVFKFAFSEMMFSMVGGDPNSFLKASEKTFGSSKNIKITESKTYNELGNQVFEIAVEFKSIKNFNDLREKGEVPPFIGKISLSKGKNGQVMLKRVLAKGKEDLDPNMLAAVANSKWSYELKLPYKILAANTAKSNINQKENTVRWEFSMLSVYQGQSEMTVTMETFNPLIYLYIAGSIVSLLVIVGVIYIILRRKKTIVME